jgi:peptidoglycan hydrolase-like protein with peptidoglycan-binding domain
MASRTMTRVAALASVALLVSAPAFAQTPRESAERGYDATKAMLLSYPDPQVRELQQALKDQGYHVGRIDGRLDNLTDEAIKKFQREHGLSSNGKLTADTMAQLRAGEHGAASPATSETKTPRKHHFLKH